MSVLRLLGFGSKPLPTQLKIKLPQVNSFVDLMMAAGGPRGSVCLEAMSDRTLIAGALPGMKAGATGVFSYTNPVGRFRFSSKCLEIRGPNAVFAIPERVETLQVFSGVGQRGAVRIETAVPVQWRPAPVDRGLGEYARGSLTDISRSGASLIVEREVKPGNKLELRFSLSTVGKPLALLAEVMRNSPVETTKKVSLGLRFQGVKPDEDRAIMEFINRRQAERRNRGLA